MTLWFLIPMLIVGISVYLVISGSGETFRLTRLVIGYSILISITFVAGIAASRSSELGLIMFILGIFTTIVAFIGALFCLVLLKGWQKIHAAFTGLLFPIMLYGSIMFGAGYAPAPITVEEHYLQRVSNLMDQIQGSEEVSSLSAEYDYEGCVPYLEEKLSQHSGNYTLQVLSVTDPYPDTGPGAITDASVLVEFPDGSQVELYYYDYILQQCIFIERP